MAVGDPYARIGFDPGSVTGVHMYDTRNMGTTTGRKEVGFNDLKPKEVLEALKNEVFKKLEEERDNAKFLYEEEGDETSFGEYMGLKKAVELLEKHLKEAPYKIYNTEAMYDLKRLATQYIPNNAPPVDWSAFRP